MVKILIKTILFSLSVLIGAIIATLILNPAQGGERWGLDEAYINYRQYTPGGVSYLVTDNGLPGRQMDKGIALHLNTTFWSYFYWNNTIHAMTDKDVNGSGQFRTVGWNFKLGARVTSWLEFQYEHHSQHILDHNGPRHFPVEDSYGINLYLYRAKSKESIF